ncbi:hypothetical protein ATP_00055 [Candidatus Phytoplasma mali]|uniref:Uncharacterized protein n=1 Tax=Phytoplasma mali (strain AT) TaxID=482235 RepID=B3R078_PHYMT|nr:hypothetical protein [Candidatus Phytoplasma mali]CAP18242.1 hypothetical protein ATP_00055 [Candidatus Phytoplasma mali]
MPDFLEAKQEEILGLEVHVGSTLENENNLDNLNNSNVVTIKKINSEKFSSKKNNELNLKKFEKIEKNNKLEKFIFKDKIVKREIAKQIYIPKREFVLEEDIIKNEYEISLNPQVKTVLDGKNLKIKPMIEPSEWFVLEKNLNEILDKNLKVTYLFYDGKDFFENINENKNPKIYLIILYEFCYDALKNNDALLKKLKAFKPSENKMNHKVTICLKITHE